MLECIGHFFLRARHWQIFFLFIATQIIGFAGVIAEVISTWPSHSLFVSTLVGVVVTLPSTLCMLAWWWSTGSLLFSRIKPTRELKPWLFDFALLSLLLITLAEFLPFSSWTMPRQLTVYFAVFLFALFATFYPPFFLSRCLVITNKGRTTLGSGEVKFFFLFLFWFVGVWVIQPRINQLYAEEANR